MIVHFLFYLFAFCIYFFISLPPLALCSATLRKSIYDLDHNSGGSSREEGGSVLQLGMFTRGKK